MNREAYIRGYLSKEASHRWSNSQAIASAIGAAVGEPAKQANRWFHALPSVDRQKWAKELMSLRMSLGNMDDAMVELHKKYRR